MRVEIQPGTDPDLSELLQDHVVMGRRRVLLEHRVQRLERSQRVLLGRDRLEHVASRRDRCVLLTPSAERGEPVLGLELVHRGRVVLVVDQGAPEDQDPRGV